VDYLVAIAVELRGGAKRFYMTWGRIQHPVDPAPLEQLVLRYCVNEDLGDEPVEACVCRTLQEASRAPYFYEALFSFGQTRIPFGDQYEAWRSALDERMQRGEELYYLGNPDRFADVESIIKGTAELAQEGIRRDADGGKPRPYGLCPTGSAPTCFRTEAVGTVPCACPVPTDENSPFECKLVSESVETDWVTVIESHIDNMSGELLGGLMERLFSVGALDVSYTPIQMKKSRPAILLTVLCPPEMGERLALCVLQETTTLGVRIQQVRRLKAQRYQETVETLLGPIVVKVKRLGSRVVSAAPEYEECQRMARERGIPLIEVYEVVRAAMQNAISSSF
jgi:hypothetical protein